MRTTRQRVATGYRMVRLAALLAFALAAPVAAAPLASASFTFQLGTLPGFTFPGVGATGTATSNLSASLGAGTAFNGAFTTSIPTSAAPPLTGLQMIVTKNAGGTFTGATPGQVGGNLAFEGVYNIDGIGGLPGGGLPLLAIPLQVGTPSTLFVSAGGVSLTAIAAGWTVGTAAVTGIATSLGSVTETVTKMGINALTPGGAGTLVLVTPLRVDTNVAGRLFGFGALTLTYVPEPGTALLLGLGAVGLAALARRRR